MPVFRVNKTEDYTTISNTFLKEKKLSLKAKGLLCVIFGLPNNWDYSISGLVSICKENETSISSALKELKEFGYLEIEKILPNQTKSGRFEYIYNIYETPQKQDLEKQGVEKQDLEILGLENQGQLNTNILNTNELNNNNIPKTEKTKPIRHKYGVYGRVLLTDAERSRLFNEFGEETITNQINLLDEYIESNNNKNKYTNFNLVLRKSIRENWFTNNRNINNKTKKVANEPEWLKDYQTNFENGVDDL